MVMYLNVAPGVVAAIFFIVFDVLILALLDVVLAHIVCAIYYRNIHHGRPISVQSADIPGVTTYLLGKLFSFTNILALGLKISFIIIVFAVNLDIDGEVVYRHFPEYRRATFDFDPSHDAWGSVPIRAVLRDRGFMEDCYNQTADTEAFSIFRIAYNLSGGATPQTETVGLHGSLPINASTIACLDDGVEEPQVLANVTGCSAFLSDICANGTTAFFEPDIVPTDQLTAQISDDELHGENFKFIVDIYNGTGMPIEFPQYTDPVMFCSWLCPGPQPRECCSFQNSVDCNAALRPCVLVATIGNDTLIERWEIVDEIGTRPVLRRDFPGPKFQGSFNMSLQIIIMSLQDPSDMMDWRTYAVKVAADASVYRKVQLRYNRREKRVVTILPTYAVVLGAAALTIAVVSRVIVSLTLGKDDRPRFNSIDGLSSIVREENAPSGRSYQSGDTVVVGLSHRGMNGVHFGPLQYRQESVRREDREIM